MPRYRVLGQILHDGVRYGAEPPDQALIVVADAAQAQALIAAGLIAPEPTPEPQTEQAAPPPRTKRAKP